MTASSSNSLYQRFKQLFARRPHTAPLSIKDALRLSSRLADLVSASIGSWSFLLLETFVCSLWIILNTTLGQDKQWDIFPFILLNLFLSTQALFSAPIIMMSQNRSSEVDRLKVEDLHEKVDHIRLNQCFNLYDRLQITNDRLRMLKLKLQQLQELLRKWEEQKRYKQQIERHYD